MFQYTSTISALWYWFTACMHHPTTRSFLPCHPWAPQTSLCASTTAMGVSLRCAGMESGALHALLQM
jgi:hypothetical protein